jgi:NADP-dependent 3-hydroxy acid dehydrogenase YdfG
MKPFEGLVAVVTGASSGIGQATAHALADRGAHVCLVGRDLETLQRASQCGTGHTSCYVTDLTDDAQVHDLVAALEQDMGRIDVLIHSAAVIALGSTDSALIENFDYQYRTNLRAPFLLTKLSLPMLRRTRGQVIFMNSNAALRPGPQSGQYAATKAGLRAVADSLREETQAAGMRVLSLFIGRTATPMQQSVHQHEGAHYSPDLLIQPQNVADIVVSVISLPRTVEVTELSLRAMRTS